jgi:LysR family transcriptional regulator for bpeEF and oprC
MNLVEHLRAFVRVAQCGSFSLAAEQLGVAQSVMSKHVAMLERHLGVRLLSRTTRQMKLTNEGATYLAFAQRILDDVEEAESLVRRSKGSPSGLVRIGSPYSFAQHFLVAVVAKLLIRYPSIETQIVVSDMSPNLIEQDIDIAVRFGELSGDLISKRIGTVPRIAVASPVYIEEFGEPATPGDLIHHQCVLYDNPAVNRPWTFRRESEQIAINVKGRFSANSAQIVRNACLSGLGIAVMPDWLFEGDLASGRLVRILKGYEPENLPLSLVHTSRKYVSLKTRTVVDFLSDELHRALAPRPDRQLT